MTNALDFIDVSAGYRDTRIIQDLSFSIQEGEIAGVIGPNGAGKTTLLRAITGLIRHAAGTVRLFGQDVTALAARERARLVGVVPQDLETPMAFTVEEIVAMGRTASIGRWCAPSAEDRRGIERAMAYTDVIDMRGRPFTELSGGERQRVVIAMVLAQQPRLILMDEPTSHLDMNHRLEVMEIVERLNREQRVTVLIVSHDLNLSAEFCRRLILLDRGRLVADGTPRDVLNEELLRRVYHCEVRVQQSPASGAVLVLPAPRLTALRPGKEMRVHVVAGGGCGEEVLRRLLLCGCTVTCGVLNELDSDAEAAAALGIETALEKPFSPVGPVALQKAQSMALRADALIVCGVPFGPGNAVNLDLAAQALAAGKRVFLMEGIETRDYTPDRRAARRASELVAAGARPWRSLADLLQMLSE
jgi:iron complex transport system ATP-binding protein